MLMMSLNVPTRRREYDFLEIICAILCSEWTGTTFLRSKWDSMDKMLQNFQISDLAFRMFDRALAVRIVYFISGLKPVN